MTSLRGQRIGGFKILDELQSGTGSQGAVYRAVCDEASVSGIEVGDMVAIKVMSATGADDRQWEKLQRSTAELAQLEHPNVVRYLGCFRETGAFTDTLVVIEEFLEGETLKDVLARNPSGLDADETLRIAAAALDALAFVSSCGIVHRDVKPGNIFLCRDGSVKLIDFEIACHDSGGTTSSTAAVGRGTYDYMAPEFAEEGFRGDVRSDVFSFGVVLHEMLVGKLPYPRIDGERQQAGFAFLERWSRYVSGGQHPIRISSRIGRLVGGAEAVLSKALNPNRASRFADFATFRKALDGIRFNEIRNGEKVYRLQKFIGKGGFGEVFKARELASGQEVAIKHLLKSAYAERFHREARIMAQLDDPCFVRLHDFFALGVPGAQDAFLVMDFLPDMPGSSLRDAIRARKGGALAFADVCKAFLRYAHGLSVMHERGIFHRDIKPSNLYYPAGKPDSAAIMDLGIARDENGTATVGQVPGTLDYMPPEVVVGTSRGDGRMDIYALGLCLYEALTGKLGFPRLPSGPSGYSEFFLRARSMKAPDLSDPLVLANDRLHALLHDMTNPDAGRRIRTAEEVVQRLKVVLENPVERGSASVPIRPAVTPSAPPVRRVSRKDSVVQPVVASRPHPLRMPTPVSAPRQELPARPRADHSREMRLAVNGLIAAGVIAALAFAAYLAFPSVKLMIARSQLKAVGELFMTGDPGAAEAAEREWLRRWAPRGGAFLELAYPDFIDCTNGLVQAKAVAHDRRERARIAAEQAAERADAMGRISACRRFDGKLDEAAFARLDGWELPSRLIEDQEIQRTVAAMSRCLVAAVKVKLENAPVDTRRSRIVLAKRIVANSWTPRILEDFELKALESDIGKSERAVVGVVGNSCDDPICIGDVEIAPGGTHELVLSDGRVSGVVISRRGYRPIDLPADFDGRTILVQDSDFAAATVKMYVPRLDEGISCTVSNMVCVSRSEIRLVPGDHVCTYTRKGYESQHRPFTVRVNHSEELPRPGEWRRLSGKERKSPEFDFSNPASALVAESGDAGDAKDLDLGAMIKDTVRKRCLKLLAAEPITGRQERLDEAGRILTRAVAFDRSMSEAEAKPIYTAIEQRRKWAVGKVVNGCSGDLLIAGRVVPKGEERVLIFESGIPEKWTAELKGYKTLDLVRDFDGCTLRLSNGDFRPLNPLDGLNK